LAAPLEKFIIVPKLDYILLINSDIKPTVLYTCLLRIHLCWLAPGSILVRLCCLCLTPACLSFSLLISPNLVRIGFDFFSFIHFPEFSFSPFSKIESIWKSSLLVMLYLVFFVYFFYYWLHLLLACVCLCIILIFSAQVVFVVSISVGVLVGKSTTLLSLHRATAIFIYPFLVSRFSLFFCSSLVLFVLLVESSSASLFVFRFIKPQLGGLFALFCWPGQWQMTGRLPSLSWPPSQCLNLCAAAIYLNLCGFCQIDFNAKMG